MVIQGIDKEVLKKLDPSDTKSIVDKIMKNIDVDTLDSNPGDIKDKIGDILKGIDVDLLKKSSTEEKDRPTNISDSNYDKMASDIVENLDVEALKQKRMKNLDNKGKFFLR